MEICDILIVDDEVAIAGLYEAFLKLTPYSFEIVNSGEDAVELIKRINFSMCVLDINLGSKSMTGIDTAIAIKERNTESKVYALTGNAFLFDGFDPTIAGFDGIFSKPMGYKDLLTILDKQFVKTCK